MGGGLRAIQAIAGHVRTRLARQISDSHVGPGGYIPMVTLSPEWEIAFSESLVGPPEDRQLAIPPSKLNEFMQRFRTVFESVTANGEAPVLLCSGAIRAHVRAIVERLRPATPVLAQTEIYARARIRTLGRFRDRSLLRRSPLSALAHAVRADRCLALSLSQEIVRKLLSICD